jgi:hypothetical protein
MHACTSLSSIAVQLSGSALLMLLEQREEGKGGKSHTEVSGETGKVGKLKLKSQPLYSSLAELILISNN